MIVALLQTIFYLLCIGVMCLIGCMLWHQRELIKRQLENLKLKIRKLKPSKEEK